MGKYYIDNEEVKKEKFYSTLEDKTMAECEDNYDEWLNEVYGDVNICGLNYAASIALLRVDEIAYKCGLNDYHDGFLTDKQYELSRYGEIEIDGIVFEIRE